MTDCNAKIKEGMQALEQGVRSDLRFPGKMHRSDIQSPPITTLGDTAWHMTAVDFHHGKQIRLC